MGCQFPIPQKYINDERASNALMYSTENKIVFSDYYQKSISMENDMEADLVMTMKRKRIQAKTNRNSIFNPVIDNLVRNESGAVVERKVRAVMQIREPGMKTDDLVLQLRESLEKEAQDGQGSNDSQTGSVSAVDDVGFHALISGEMEETRGHVWKSLTHLDSYKCNGFVDYADIACKQPTKLNAEYIDKDLFRIVPAKIYYSKEYAEGLNSLRRVLESLSIYHEDISYFNTIGFI